jgi:hypothetical protein
MNKEKKMNYSKDRWDYGRYMEEILHLSEIVEVPGIREARDELVAEMWKRFPVECEAIGLTDGVK